MVSFIRRKRRVASAKSLEIVAQQAETFATSPSASIGKPYKVLPPELWEKILSHYDRPEDIVSLWTALRNINAACRSIVERMAVKWLKKDTLILAQYDSKLPYLHV